jgi:hypothetical protein
LLTTESLVAEIKDKQSQDNTTQQGGMYW